MKSLLGLVTLIVVMLITGNIYAKEQSINVYIDYDKSSEVTGLIYNNYDTVLKMGRVFDKLSNNESIEGLDAIVKEANKQLFMLNAYSDRSDDYSNLVSEGVEKFIGNFACDEAINTYEDMTNGASKKSVDMLKELSALALKVGEFRDNTLEEKCGPWMKSWLEKREGKNKILSKDPM